MPGKTDRRFPTERVEQARSRMAKLLARPATEPPETGPYYDPASPSSSVRLYCDDCEILAIESCSQPPGDFVDIVFSGPPGHLGGQFIEVENSQGKSIRFGEWRKRADAYWVLRIPASPVLRASHDKMTAALNEIACWEDGPIVNGSFDDPHSAKLAREGLASTAINDPVKIIVHAIHDDDADFDAEQDATVELPAQGEEN